jgi:hypothetical protein
MHDLIYQLFGYFSFFKPSPISTHSSAPSFLNQSALPLPNTQPSPFSSTYHIIDASHAIAGSRIPYCRLLRQ